MPAGLLAPAERLNLNSAWTHEVQANIEGNSLETL